MITFNLTKDYDSIEKFDHFVLRTICCYERQPWDIVVKEVPKQKHCHVLYGCTPNIPIFEERLGFNFPRNAFEKPLHYFEDYDQCLEEVSFLSNQLSKPVLNYLIKTTY